MESKSLLYGIVGFILGGLIVAIAASVSQPNHDDTTHDSMDMAMTSMTDTLREKSGDSYDQEFIAQMIAHHQGALDMAKLSATRAKHDEVKQLSTTIIATQTKEIEQLRMWQKGWGYTTPTNDDHDH